MKLNFNSIKNLSFLSLVLGNLFFSTNALAMEDDHTTHTGATRPQEMVMREDQEMMGQGSSHPNPIFTRGINDQEVQAMELEQHLFPVEQRELAQQAYEKLKPLLERNDRKEILGALGESIRDGNIEEVRILASIGIKKGDDPYYLISTPIGYFIDRIHLLDNQRPIDDLRKILSTARKRNTNSLSMIKTLDSFGFFTAPLAPIYAIKSMLYWADRLWYREFPKALNKEFSPEEKNLYEKIGVEQAKINVKVIEYILEKKEVKRFLDNSKNLYHKEIMPYFIVKIMLNNSKNASIGEPLFRKILTLGKKILCLTNDLAQGQESLWDSLK